MSVERAANPSQEPLAVYPSALSVIGQLIGLVAPFLYLLGSNYASNYFRGLGCEWVLPLLTVQETIYYALPSAVPMALGMAVSLELMLGGTQFRASIKLLTCVFVGSLIIEAILRIFTDFNFVDLATRITSKWIFGLFGAYLAYVFLSLKLHASKHLKATTGLTIGFAFSAYMFSGQLGGADANTALTTNNTFPAVTKGYTFGDSESLRLIAKVGDKYLLMRNTEDNKAFKIESNIDSYTIHHISEVHAN